MEGLKRLRKRTLALFMALTLCLSLVQVTAYAEDGTPDGGEILPVEDAACEHDWSKYIVTRAATCTEAGEETLACAKCDLLITEVEAPEEIEGYEELEKTREIPAAGHTWGEWAETLAATEEAEGEEVRICAVCQAEETRTTEKLAPAPEIESAPVQSAPAKAGADNGISPTAEDENEPALITKEEDLKNAVVAGGVVKLGSDITLNSTLVIDNTVTLDLNGKTLARNTTGRVITIAEGGALTLADTSGETETATVTNSLGSNTITCDKGKIRNTSQWGGGVYVAAGGAFILEGGTICDSKAITGGGVYVVDGRFEMVGGTICNNQCMIDNIDCGGGVAVSGEDASFIMTGGKITGNTGRCGGGVNIWNGASFEMSAPAEISGNTADFSRAGWGGGVYVEWGSFLMHSGTISGNTASKWGGGVVVAGRVDSEWNPIADEPGTFRMEGGTISGNTAQKGGGGVDVDRSNAVFTMTGGQITNNTAKNGGGVNLEEAANFNLEGGTISENTANASGGGVCLETGDANQFTMTGGEISGNTASTYGGGVYVMQNALFEMSNGSITQNTATQNGGGVYDSGTFNMTGGSISNNTATTLTGGGVCVHTTNNDTWPVFTMTGGAIEKCEAGWLGGGVCAFTESNSIAKFAMTGGTIRECKADGGGGVTAGLNGRFEMSGSSTITKCEATDGANWGNYAGFGGGVSVCFTNASCEMNGGEISHNVSRGVGGGVFVDRSDSFEMKNGSISNNESEWDGGGIYNSGKFTMENGCFITGNSGKGDGGGIWLQYETSSFTMNGGEISGNSISGFGGGVGLIDEGSTFTMNGGIITGNQAGKSGGGVSNGGGIYPDEVAEGGSSTSTISSGEIHNNHATESGDDIYNVGGSSSLTLSVDSAIKGWILNDTGCGHIIDGWYYDGYRPVGDDSVDTTRWNFDDSTKDKYAEKWDLDTSAQTIVIALKAAHSDPPIPAVTLHYDANGDTVSNVPGDQRTQAGEGGNVLPVSETVPTRPGYIFTGWNTQADGSGISYPGGSSITLTEDVTLYAQWTPAVTVTWKDGYNDTPVKTKDDHEKGAAVAS